MDAEVRDIIEKTLAIYEKCTLQCYTSPTPQVFCLKHNCQYGICFCMEKNFNIDNRSYPWNKIFDPYRRMYSFPAESFHDKDFILKCLEFRINKLKSILNDRYM